jgi:PAS domain S-box-containing protein
MPQTIKHDQIFVVDSKRWFLLLRLFLSLLLSGSALAFLKASTFNHASIAVYGLLSIVYFAYNFMTGHHSERFGRMIVMAQLGSELLVEGLLVNHVGGSFSPYVLFFIISIVISALYFHLYGSIATATFAGLLYSLPVAFDLSFLYEGLIEAPRFAGMGISSDEAFYTVFLHLCLFYFFAFISGYLAQKLFVTSLELKRLRLETGEILEQMRSGLLTVDDERRIVYFNRAAGQILGVDPEGVRGRLLEDVLGENQAELVMRVTEALRSMRAEDRSEIIIYRRDYPAGPVSLSHKGRFEKPEGSHSGFSGSHGGQEAGGENENQRQAGGDRKTVGRDSP